MTEAIRQYFVRQMKIKVKAGSLLRLGGGGSATFPPDDESLILNVLKADRRLLCHLENISSLVSVQAIPRF